jgi:hypothetical protein
MPTNARTATPIVIARIGSDGLSPDANAVPPSSEEAPAVEEGDAAADPDADADPYRADCTLAAAAEPAIAAAAELVIGSAADPDTPLVPLGAARSLPGRVMASACHDPARGCVTATAAAAAAFTVFAALATPDANESSSAARIDR